MPALSEWRNAPGFRRGVPPYACCSARQMRSGVAGIGRSLTPSGARASRMAFITAGVRGDGAALAHTFGAERVGRARDRAEVDRERRQGIGARNGVIEQAAGQQLAVTVVDDLFEQRLARALGDAARGFAPLPGAG